MAVLEDGIEADPLNGFMQSVLALVKIFASQWLNLRLVEDVDRRLTVPWVSGRDPESVGHPLRPG